MIWLLTHDNRQEITLNKGDVLLRPDRILEIETLVSRPAQVILTAYGAQDHPGGGWGRRRTFDRAFLSISLSDHIATIEYVVLETTADRC